MTTNVRQTVLCPFTVLIDQREKAPYPFRCIRATANNRGKVWQVSTATTYLETGDYAIDGCPGIAIERKTLEDLYSTLGQHRKRFKAEIERLAELEFGAVVIEADLREAWRPGETRPNWRSKLWPRSVEGTIVSWSMRYPTVHWWFCGSRRAAEVRTFGTLEMFWRQKTADG